MDSEYVLATTSKSCLKVQLCGGRPQRVGRNRCICSICLLPKEGETECPSCCHIGNRLVQLQQDSEDLSLTRVIEALKEWSLDAPTWDILYWINRLLQPSVARGRRMSGPRQGLFIVFEGIDGSGKTFHMDAVKEALISRSCAIHSVVFPNNQIAHL